MKKGEKFKLIIFDFDGTLVNSLPFHILAFKDMLLEHGIKIQEEELNKLVGLSTKNIFNLLKKKYKFKEDLEALREERRYHYFKFLGKKNILFPGVIKILENLILKNYKLAIATGSSEVTFSHTVNNDFKVLFDEIVTITDIKKGKPAPDQLLFIAKKLKVKPKECLVVGDSVYDGQAAQRAKMSFIGVRTGYTKERDFKKYKPLAILNSVAQLGKFL
jgi:HAD superfamily hydrolase (TIGR01509 family)